MTATTSGQSHAMEPNSTVRGKVVLYANCQGAALAWMLKSVPAFDQSWQVVFSSAVQSTPEERQKELLGDLGQNVDIVIAQPVRDGYRNSDLYGTRRVLGSVRPGARTLLFPSIQFHGYFAGMKLMKAYSSDASKASLDAFGSPLNEVFHFPTIAACYLEGAAPAEAAMRFQSGDGITSDFALRVTQNSIQHLKLNEAQCLDLADGDSSRVLGVADAVERHYQADLLFYTPRHPTRRLLGIVASDILKHLGIAPPAEFKPDPLDFIRYPIHPGAYHGLAATFPLPTHFVVKQRQFEIAEMCEIFYRIYKQCTPARIQEIAALDAAASH